MIKEIKRHLLASIDETNSRIGDSTVRDSIKLKTSISTAKKIYSFIEDLEKEAKKTDNILNEADNIVNNNTRGYGDVIDSFSAIAEITNGILNTCEKTAMQCGILKPSIIAKVMISIKLHRESVSHKRDNLTDLCGYSEILNKIEDDNTI